MESTPGHESTEKEPRFSTVIVLGKMPEEREDGSGIKLTEEGKRRLFAASILYRTGLTRRIAVSGGFTHGSERPSEAQLMRDFLVERCSVPEADIILEEESRTTLENIERTMALLPQNAGTIAIISNAAHLKRVEVLLRRANVTAETASTESILRESGSPTVEGYMRQHQRSLPYRLNQLKETISRAILIVDRNDSLHALNARLRRSDPRSES